MYCSKCGLEIVEENKKECPICNAPLVEQSGQKTLKNGDRNEDELTSEDELTLKELIEDVNKNLEVTPDTGIKSTDKAAGKPLVNIKKEGSVKAKEEEITPEALDTVLDELDTADKVKTSLKRKRSSKVIPAAAVIIVVFIAAVGGSMFYLRSKQEPSVVIPEPKTKAAKKEDKVLRKVLKKEEKEIIVKKEPVSDRTAQTVQKGIEQQKVEAVKVTPEVTAKNNMLRQKSQEKITEKYVREKVIVENSSLAEPVAEGETFFTIQVSTMLNKSFAETFVNQLKKKGYSVYVVERENPKGKLVSNIRIGKYKTEAEAKRVALSFREKEKIPYLIVKSKGDASLKVIQDRPAAVFSAPEKKSVLPEHPGDEEQLSRASITQEDLLPSTPEKLARKDEKTTEMKVTPEGTAKEKKEPVKPVDVKKQTPSFATYSIHAGSYRDRKRAVSEANRLKGLGFDAYTEEVNLGEKEIWHRVKIGRFGTPEEALKVQEELIQKDSKISSRIIKSQP
jgi:cell division septation protein DedD